MSLESQWNIDSNNILSIRKYCQLFIHESNTFLGDQYVIPPIHKNGGANAEKCQKQSLPLEAHGPLSNTSMPRPTPLTTSNDSLIAVRTSAQLCNKVPMCYNGTPQIHPQNYPFDDHYQNLVHPFLNQPLTTPNGIQIQSAISPQYTLRTDKQTDRQMVRANVPYHEHSRSPCW